MDDLNDLRYVINIKNNNIEEMKLESKLYIYPNSTLASKLKCSTNYIFTKKILRRLNIFLEEKHSGQFQLSLIEFLIIIVSIEHVMMIF